MYRSINAFGAQSAATTRRVLTAILLTQTWQTYTAAQSNGVQPDPGKPVDPQQQHRFVLSASNFAAHFSMHNNMHSMLEFVEDLFAVRIPKFVAFAVIFIFSLVIAKILPLIFDEILRRFRTPDNYRATFWYILQGFIVVFGIWLALAAVGIDFFGILFTFGVITIAISQAIGPSLGNVFSGLMVQTEGHVRLGADITVEGVRGIVVDMSLSAVTIKQLERNVLSVIPNSHFSQLRVDINLPENGALRTVVPLDVNQNLPISISMQSAYHMSKAKHR